MWKLPAALFLEHVLHLVAWKSIDRQRDRFVSEAKAAVEKSQNGAGAAPLFRLRAAQKVFRGRSRPPAHKSCLTFFHGQELQKHSDFE